MRSATTSEGRCEATKLDASRRRDTPSAAWGGVGVRVVRRKQVLITLFVWCARENYPPQRVCTHFFSFQWVGSRKPVKFRTKTSRLKNKKKTEVLKCDPYVLEEGQSYTCYHVDITPVYSVVCHKKYNTISSFCQTTMLFRSPQEPPRSFAFCKCVFCFSYVFYAS